MTHSDPDASAARESVDADLERVVRRWQQLPLDRALSAVPLVAELVQQLADEVAVATGLPRQDVPDLGPAVLPEQLRVMVHDHLRAGPGAGPLDLPGLAGRLRALRRSLP